MDDPVERLGQQVAVALRADDPGEFAPLLHPDVTWGAPGDPAPSCRNREQVLSWYRRGWGAGRVDVRSVAVCGDKILVSVVLGSAPGDSSGDGVARWQVLTVVDGKIADIRGYDDESSARQAAGAP